MTTLREYGYLYLKQLKYRREKVNEIYSKRKVKGLCRRCGKEPIVIHTSTWKGKIVFIKKSSYCFKHLVEKRS